MQLTSDHFSPDRSLAALAGPSLPHRAPAGSRRPVGFRKDFAPPQLKGVQAVRDRVAEWIEEGGEQTLWVASVDQETGLRHLSAYPGGVTEMEASVGLILRDALGSGGAGLIVLRHNSRGLSAGDRAAGYRLALAAEALGLTLLDYLVFTGTDCLSLRRRGYL